MTLPGSWGYEVDFCGLCEPLLLTITETAHELRVHRKTVERLIRDGRIPAVRLGPASRRVRREDLLVYIAACES